MSRNNFGGQYTVNIDVAPRERRVSRNICLPSLSSHHRVAPRERRVSRNTDFCDDGEGFDVAPRERRVSRNFRWHRMGRYL